MPGSEVDFLGASLMIPRVKPPLRVHIRASISCVQITLMRFFSALVGKLKKSSWHSYVMLTFAIHYFSAPFTLLH